MARYVLIVLSNPTDGKEEEYKSSRSRRSTKPTTDCWSPMWSTGSRSTWRRSNPSHRRLAWD